jgi:hypothetical protein
MLSNLGRRLLTSKTHMLLLNDIGNLGCLSKEVKVPATRALTCRDDIAAKGVIVEIIARFL